MLEKIIIGALIIVIVLLLGWGGKKLLDAFKR